MEPSDMEAGDIFRMLKDNPEQERFDEADMQSYGGEGE